MILFIVLFLIILFNVRFKSSNIVKCDPNHKWIYMDTNVGKVMVCEVCKKRPEDLM